MALTAIGVGLGRTGTNSLKVALERLLGGRCYHTHELLLHLEQVPLWDAAFAGDADWDAIFHGYNATVDWPACTLWPALTQHYPDAVVILSTRTSPGKWWRSAHRTVFASMKRGPLPGLEDWYRMMEVAMRPFTGHWDDRAVALAAYEDHNARVRALVPADRLVEWSPEQGWAPLSRALGRPVPAEPFPHLNTTSDFRALAALDE